jgi:hypothetical protein
MFASGGGGDSAKIIEEQSLFLSSGMPSKKRVSRFIARKTFSVPRYQIAEENKMSSPV